MLNEMFEKYNLIKLQNHQVNCNQDNLTFCAFFNTEKEFANLAERLQANIDRKGK